MDRQADPMAQAMAEIVTVARLGNYVPGKAVAFLAGHAGPHRVDGGKLRSQHDAINLVEHFVRLAHYHGAGNVAAIAANLGAHVDYNRLAGLNYLVAGPVVGHGAVGPGGHDGIKADVVGPELPHRNFHPPGYFLLGHSGFDGGADGFHCGIGGVNGLLQQAQLFLIFENPQFLSDAGGGDQRSMIQCRVFLQGVQHPVIGGYGDIVALEANALRPGFLQCIQQPVPAGPQLHHLKMG